MLFLELVPLRGGKNVKPRLQNRILVPLRGSFQNFPRAPPSFLYGSPPRDFFLSYKRANFPYPP